MKLHIIRVKDIEMHGSDSEFVNDLKMNVRNGVSVLIISDDSVMTDSDDY